MNQKMFEYALQILQNEKENNNPALKLLCWGLCKCWSQGAQATNKDICDVTEMECMYGYDSKTCELAEGYYQKFERQYKSWKQAQASSREFVEFPFEPIDKISAETIEKLVNFCYDAECDSNAIKVANKAKKQNNEDEKEVEEARMMPSVLPQPQQVQLSDIGDNHSAANMSDDDFTMLLVFVFDCLRYEKKPEGGGLLYLKSPDDERQALQALINHSMQAEIGPEGERPCLSLTVNQERHLKQFISIADNQSKLMMPAVPNPYFASGYEGNARNILFEPDFSQLRELLWCCRYENIRGSGTLYFYEKEYAEEAVAILKKIEPSMSVLQVSPPENGDYPVKFSDSANLWERLISIAQNKELMEKHQIQDNLLLHSGWEAMKREFQIDGKFWCKNLNVSKGEKKALYYNTNERHEINNFISNLKGTCGIRVGKQIKDNVCCFEFKLKNWKILCDYIKILAVSKDPTPQLRRSARISKT